MALTICKQHTKMLLWDSSGGVLGSLWEAWRHKSSRCNTVRHVKHLDNALTVMPVPCTGVLFSFFFFTMGIAIPYLWFSSITRGLKSMNKNWKPTILIDHKNHTLKESEWSRTTSPVVVRHNLLLCPPFRLHDLETTVPTVDDEAPRKQQIVDLSASCFVSFLSINNVTRKRRSWPWELVNPIVCGV